MKRTLVLIRHAKSDWGNPLLNDYDRPLNARGERDAPELGRRLRVKGIRPDGVIASTAQRADQTARAVVTGLGLEESMIQWERSLYHCRPETFETVLFGVDDALTTVFIVAHNPGISMFAQQLLPGQAIDDLPTCAALAVSITADRWIDLPTASKSLLFLDTPKHPSEGTY